MSISDFQKSFQNPFFYGVMSFNGELYEGKHEPIISKRLFDRVLTAKQWTNHDHISFPTIRLCPARSQKRKHPARSISRHELHHQFAQLHSRSVKSLVQQFLRRGAVACHWFVFLDRGTPYPLAS
jgi:hypothetical protein